ncbi:hypothetical protein [Bifidobacterium sp.]|jgi:DNA-binding CsgD family transcriptional regulator|uniref:hypothetical protein n=1 Tax=Bifidobacterium sp. TaxID=41200 RepID=UPI0025C31FEF|nr:hypothetical protein [Bifidobacterium sp.]MCH4160218.1 hypothetical protein [Bifidobacterium sp.]MCH4174311.1 hypothetical protein [Bifidobacterium sp.]MCI1635725.1 hypothetical protein [Bifidobacterium sp.]
MPWWIWLVITIAMFVILGIGIWYVITHALRALAKVSDVGAAAGEKLSALNLSPSDNTGIHEAPLFTQPLEVATERYAEAHSRVVERKTNKRIAHMRRWERWKHFND